MSDHGQNERPVMLVDDDSAVLEPLAIALRQQLSCPVASFNDGLSALDFFADHTVGLAVLDVDMPQMSGLVLAQKLRAKASDLPIMFLTGSTQRDLAAELAALGAVASLRKPIAAKELAVVVDRFRLR